MVDKKKIDDTHPVAYIILCVLIAALAVLAFYIAIAGSIDAVIYIIGNGISGFLLFWIIKYKVVLIISLILSLAILLLFRKYGFINDETFK
ncbi:MAG: hypothetical protein IKR19_08725 [Acholeplasmatales bacterium]|nr:hypothetical protein [Acholeplasmatales bacterium]